MKKKLFILQITAIMISATASSQTIKDNLDQLSKDPATKERAEKADVLIHKKVITDSTRKKTTPEKTVVRTTGANKVKHKKGKHKLKLKKPSK